MDILESFIPWFGLIVIIAINARYYYSRYRNHPTFEEYKSAHPDRVRNGRVLCYLCGGNIIKMRGLYAAVDRRKTHYCVTCGNPLYRSYH